MFEQWVTKLLEPHIKEPKLEVPPDQKLGDFAFACFPLAKELKKSPLQIAQDLAEKIKPNEHVDKIVATGPYLNFFLNKERVAKEVISKVRKENKKYGSQSKNKTVVIEYCGPNTNKPLHLGHMRNMALGLAVSKILSFLGNKVHPVNIINDRGIHICKSMLAYKKWGENKEPHKKGDHFVGDFYVIFARNAKENPDLEKEAQQMLVDWENGDKEVRAIWKKMNDWVLEGFAQTYKRFGVNFEKDYHESDYYEQGKEVAEEGLKKGVFEKDETGAIIAPLEKHKLSDKVVLRSDGTSIYITQDMYLVNMRYEDYKFDDMIYVVASEQNLHFKQLFKILELLKKPYAEKCHHLSYGLVNLPSGRMKSREGTVVDADDLMDELVKISEIGIKQRHQDLTEDEILLRAEAIGVSAIKFFLVKTDAVKDMLFDPEKSISFEGETGPYLQYTHARCCSILKRVNAVDKVDFSLLSHELELGIITLLSQFPAKIEEAGRNYKPHILCRHLLDLAKSFNEYYHHKDCKVISENKDLMQARILLVDSVRQVLEIGLNLLGIEAPEEM